MAEKKVLAKPRAKILYYQFKEQTRVVNFIYQIRKEIHIAELRRIPFEEGILLFFKHSKGQLLSSEVNIHEFAAHLSSAYRKKS